jgi:hypothetical protein
MKFIIYVAVLLAVAAGLALGLDRLTSPPKKLEANARQPASEAVRKIPIKRATAKENGDPNNQLTPVYPAAPGKDLPVKDVAETEPNAPPAETSGSAPAREAEAAQPNPPALANTALATPATTAAPNVCNVQACEAAYRSFRESDCSYQPFDGPRKFCDATQAAAQAAASPSPVRAGPPPAVDARSAQRRDDQDLQDAIRTVRDLPPPSLRYEDDPRIVVVEPPDGAEYGLRRRWILERR